MRILNCFATVQAAVNEATKLAGVDLVHPAQIKASRIIVEDVKKEIREADVVVAILTGQNPNVFYELGIALETAVRPAILIVGSDDDVPFDIRPHRYLTYKGCDQLAGLPATLAEAIRATLARPPTTLQLQLRHRSAFMQMGSPCTTETLEPQTIRRCRFSTCPTFMTRSSYSHGEFVLLAMLGTRKSWLR